MNGRPAVVGAPPQEPRVTRSVFRNLLISMIAFGVLVGLIFPPFARLVLGTDRALSPQFIGMCIAAGFLVGLVNFLLFSMVVSRDLERVIAGMRKVLTSVDQAESHGEGCAEDCQLRITSNDAIGEIERAFNEMTAAIARRLALEQASLTLNARLSASVELKEVSMTILTTMAEIYGAKGGLLYGDTGEVLALLANLGIDQTDQVPSHLTSEFGPVVQALETGQMVSLSPDMDGLAWISQTTPLAQYRPRSLILIPLLAKQRAAGLVLLVGDLSELSPQQVEVLETLRTQGAPYLQNSILHRKITDLAAIDDLTLILNRRFGLRRLQEEFSRSVRHGVPISVVMVDIDHFKNFNDHFGHDAGDTVLKMVAGVISRNLRAGDVVCRYGGEEFMIVAPGTGLNDAGIMAERLRRIIETNQIRWGQQQLSVTASMGVSTWPMARVSVSEELVTTADKALYAAKEFGRNQVAAHRGDKVVPLSALTMEIEEPLAEA